MPTATDNNAVTENGRTSAFMQTKLRKSNGRSLRRFLPWLIPVLLLSLWQLLSSTSVMSSSFLPSPVEVIEAAVRLTKRGELQENIWVSTRRALIGFAIGGGIGFLLGVLNGLSKISEELLDTSIQMVRTIPHLALIPLVILWFGIYDEAKIFLVALGVAFPIYLNTFNGIKNIDQRLLEMGRVYQIGRRRMFTEIVVPGAMPSILVGIRYALGIMWMSLIVAETIGSDSGIGYMATTAREFVQMDVVVLSILLYALLGKLSDVVAVLLERRFLRWNPTFAKPRKARNQGKVPA